MSSGPRPHEIWRDAAWLVQALDPPKRLVRTLRLSEQHYRDLSFLDDRLIGSGLPSALVPWDELAAAKPLSARDDVRWIFHIGHCGSTLLSRLLGELPSGLSIREPRSLRDLTFFAPEVRAQFIPGLRALMSRTFDDGQAASVKATSMVGEIAAELVGEYGRALFVHVSARNYVAGVIGGEEARADAHRLAQYRAARLAARSIRFEDEVPTDARVAAAAWACEIVALEASADALQEEQVRWVDFDQLLANPAGELESAAQALRLLATSREIEALTTGPLLHRYSKAPEFAFGPADRQQRLAKAAAEHRAEIDDALAMLERAAQESPLLARAMSRSSAEA